MTRRDQRPLETRIAEYIHGGKFTSINQMKIDVGCLDHTLVKRAVDLLVRIGSIQREMCHTGKQHYVLTPVANIGDPESASARAVLCEINEMVAQAHLATTQASAKLLELDRRIAAMEKR